MTAWAPGEETKMPAGKTEAKSSVEETATFATGCFWCTEAIFQRLAGVHTAQSGYTGGAVPNPNYRQVSSGKTGHAEAVRVIFDPQTITYDQLLEVFWKMHDPTTLNRQGADVGTQYRSAIFYHSEAQRTAAEASKKAQDASGHFARPIVTQIAAAGPFYPAEAEHDNYYNRNKNAGYCRLVILPKLEKLGMEK